MASSSLMLASPERFQTAQRMAQAFAQSDMVPEGLRGSMPNCLAALMLADEMGESPLIVMQNIFFVHGRAGWIAQYMVARANKAGIFRGPLRWETAGTPPGNPSVTCYAKLTAYPDDDPVKVTIDLKTAIESGWTTYFDKKTGKTAIAPRWATYAMQEQMLRWRSAAWLIRLHCPEVMFGLPTADELEDTMRDVTPTPPRLDDFKPSGERSRGPALVIEPDPPPEDAPPPQGETAAAVPGARGGSGESPAAAAAIPGADLVTEIDRKLTEAAAHGTRALDKAWISIPSHELDLVRGRRQHYYDLATGKEPNKC
jgi:hypothetical protein